MGESAQAFAQFYAGVVEGDGSLVHLGQPELAAALAGATVRDTGDGGQLWARKDTSVDISPLSRRRWRRGLTASSAGHMTS